MKVLTIAYGPLAKFLLEQVKSDPSVEVVDLGTVHPDPPTIDPSAVGDLGPKLLKAGTDPVRRRRRRRHRG